MDTWNSTQKYSLWNTYSNELSYTAIVFLITISVKFYQLLGNDFGRYVRQGIIQTNEYLVPWRITCRKI